ncbi:ABC transporter permease subunit [Paenibacillus macerans]|uniref:ABC transporter permease subunit n=1 Tax=Paenibacillus macerans TaxID=44252 RepID=A0A090ZYE7_PAEMA|nr:carbohydrate ABC transporter permease [Paenibacillus macerans]KFN09096.1 binding--dependent transport system inner membrane component family protein [Paenibacillus macerans]MBS5912191.1 carbohydrate ABC transporter permease [Paenibacillus macerans]MEC0154496.1 carbohydrate ABC transporter permease [Paenibacillus macerans]MEC0333813.1 carbohydrate ABC transporter permease [Paenibacillus macerans]MUG21589.1 ABC transporter permease subunit [Paenibacillus macerans]
MDQKSASAARRVKNTRIKSSGADRIFDICNYIFMVLLMAVTLYPFINVLAVSLNSAQDSLKGGIYLLPRIWTLENYKYIFREATIFHATLVSILRTIIGTVATVFCSAMVAYSISRQDFVLRKFITVAFILTMYFNGGLIPNYLLMRDLQLVGNFWVYILPGLIGVFNLIIIRSFIENLPESILESGRIDGAGDYRTFFSIVLPLTTPVLATVALFSGVFQWNSWFDVFLYNSSHIELSTLQYELQKILQNSNTTSGTSSLDGMIQGASGAQQNTVTPLSVRATMTMVASVPIIMVYPFLQKYFVKGMMVGGVKG